MTTHVLAREQLLEASPEEAWAFFSNPRNLEEITPPGLAFRIVSLDSPEMYEGQEIVYRIRIAPLVWMKWVTVIREVDPGLEFVDVQASGPYKLWHHRHTFEPVDGGVHMTDEVHYAIGFGWIGAIAHAIFVKRKLEHIFDYRFRLMEERFGGTDGGEASSCLPAGEPGQRR